MFGSTKTRFRVPDPADHDPEFRRLDNARRKLQAEEARLSARMRELHADGTIAREQQGVRRHVEIQPLVGSRPGGLVVEDIGLHQNSVQLGARLETVREELRSTFAEHGTARRRAARAAFEATRAEYAATVADLVLALAERDEPVIALLQTHRDMQEAGVAPPLSVPAGLREQAEATVELAHAAIAADLLPAETLPPATRDAAQRYNPSHPATRGEWNG